jgi:hypothetical protein
MLPDDKRPQGKSLRLRWRIERSDEAIEEALMLIIQFIALFEPRKFKFNRSAKPSWLD